MFGFALVVIMHEQQMNSTGRSSYHSPTLQQAIQQGRRHLSSTTTGKWRDFYEVAHKFGTDKVLGPGTLPHCLGENRQNCPRPKLENPKCRTGQHHFYHTMYNKWLGPYSTDDAEPFQFLEIGHYTGKGFEAYSEYLPRAEMHSIEMACIEEGPIEEGKWPYGNFPKQNPKYQEFLDTNQLHCGDASNYVFLHKTWTTNMKRPDAPPLKVVVEDASHLADHMAKSLFFWFPRIEPGGLMIIEDVEPIHAANGFRTHVLPQAMKDLHYCGAPGFPDKLCFPTIWPLLQSIHCEMHICVFERNEHPAIEYEMELSTPPHHALHAAQCLFHSEETS
jgi:hypothetical protein